MKIVQINSCINGSTGNIMQDLQNAIISTGNQGITYSRKDWSKRDIKRDDHYFIGSIIEKKISHLLEYYTGKEGEYMRVGTRKLLKQIEQFQPDVVHLHNMHGSGINLEMLFLYLKRNPQIKVIWTLHDCWSFTGHCPYFDMVECEQWKKECTKCKQYHLYPASRHDNSQWMYYRKKALFLGISNMTIVVPSQWLANLVKKSFLKQYPVRVINNGINQDIFKPTPNDIRKKYGLDDKFIILGVAFTWSERKGLNEIIQLSKTLPKNMQIVLVGASNIVEKSSERKIVCINHTESQKEMAELYSAADIFINPTLEDNYPTVNLEALSCGTPVITYNTGGSGESVYPDCGIIVQKKDIAAFREAIFRVYQSPFDSEKIIQRSKLFTKKKMTDAYLAAYEERMTITGQAII